MSKEKKYVTARKGGRCFNGAHRDGGAIIHLVPATDAGGYWGDKALCGTSPGLRGYGWSESDLPVSCEKCIKKQTSLIVSTAGAGQMKGEYE